MNADAHAVVEGYIRQVLNGEMSDARASLVANAGLGRKAAALRAAFPDLSVTIQRLFSSGADVAVHMTARGTHQGIFQGVPPTGRSWAASCSAIYRVRDGRIVDGWENWDLLTILEQIGGVTRATTASA